MLGLPMLDASSRVSIGHQYMQAVLALRADAFMALAQLGQGFLVIGGDHGHPWQGIAEGFLQPPVIDQFTANQLACDCGSVGPQAVVIGRQGPLAQVIGVNLSPAVADARANAFVAFKGFRSLTDFAFELCIASNGDVKDLDLSAFDRCGGLAIQQRSMVSVRDFNVGMGTMNQLWW